MFVNREKGGDTVIAFRQWLWVVKYNSDKGEEIADKIAEAHPKGKELLTHLREKTISGVSEWVKDYIPDALVANWSSDKKILWLHSSSMTSATTSPLVRKVAIELRAKSVQYEALDGNERDYTVTRRRGQLRGNWDSVWYHGTSTKYLEDILRLGLKPGESDSNYADQDIHHEELIFLTAKIEEAQYHGWHTARKVGGLPMVVQINHIPDKARLEPDYDVDKIASRNTYNSPEPKDYDPVFSVDSMRASKHAGLVGYRGRIPANRIDAILVYSENRGNWVRIRDLARLRNVLSRYGDDFWYRYGEPALPNRRRY